MILDQPNSLNMGNNLTSSLKSLDQSGEDIILLKTWQFTRMRPTKVL